jgi:hypothetical protein
MAFVIWVDGSRGRPPSGSGFSIYSKSGSSFQGPRASSPCDKLKTSFTIPSGGYVAKEWIVQLAHLIQGVHEHAGVRDLAREEMAQRLPSRWGEF